MNREMRVLRDVYVTSLLEALEKGNISDIKDLTDLAFSSSDNNKKRAFCEAEQIVLKSCIDHQHFDRLVTLFKEINNSDNVHLKVCSCIALSNALIEEKSVLIGDTVHSQELGRLLTQECEKLAASDREKISERVGKALKAINYNNSQQQHGGKIDEANVEQASSSMHK